MICSKYLAYSYCFQPVLTTAEGSANTPDPAISPAKNIDAVAMPRPTLGLISSWSVNIILPSEDLSDEDILVFYKLVTGCIIRE